MEQEFFELNPNPVLIYGLGSLQILKVNNAFVKKYGYDKKEASGLTLVDLHLPGEVKYLEEVMARQKSNETARKDTVRHRTREGEVFYAAISSHPITFDGQNARVVFIHDVTDRIEAQKQAQKSFDELNHHFNNSPLGMIKWSADFRIIEWSERASEVTGYSQEEVLGKTASFFQFHSEDDRQIAEQEISALLSGHKNKSRFDIKIHQRDGELIDLRIHASTLRDSEEQMISTIMFVEDVTRQKKIRLRYQRLFENANDGIFLMQGDTFIACNQQVCNIFGCKKNEILGKSPADFSPELQPDGEPSDEQARKVISKALNDGPQLFAWRHQKKRWHAD